MPSYQVLPLTSSFGAVIEATTADSIPNPDEIMELFAQNGALLLRGFPFVSDSFVQFSDQCCSSFSTYVGGGIRFRALDRESLGAGGTLMSTTGTTQGFPIPLHGEMYYQKQRPDMLWFYCERPAASRGQTTLADGREIFAQLSAESKALLRTQSLWYIRELSAEDWHTSFRTTDPDELRSICEANEMRLDMRDDGSVRIEFVSPAIISADDGREVFINNLLLLWQFEYALRTGYAAKVFGGDTPDKLPLVVRLEDGSELPEWLIRDIEAVAEPLTTQIEWQQGDVVMVDNRKILHGRRKAGGDRQILVRLGNLLPSAAV